MPLYFAYGSNMVEADMAARCPASRALGPARLARHRFVIMDNGFASMVRDPARMVHGLLWDIALSDMRGLDACESVRSGLYAKITQTVIPASGGTRRALLYAGRSGATGKPASAYMQAIIAATRAAGAPEAYLRKLAGWLPAGGPVSKSLSPPAGPNPKVRA